MIDIMFSIWSRRYLIMFWNNWICRSRKIYKFCLKNIKPCRWALKLATFTIALQKLGHIWEYSYSRSSQTNPDWKKFIKLMSLRRHWILLPSSRRDRLLIFKNISHCICLFEFKLIRYESTSCIMPLLIYQSSKTLDCIIRRWITDNIQVVQFVSFILDVFLKIE